MTSPVVLIPYRPTPERQKLLGTILGLWQKTGYQVLIQQEENPMWVTTEKIDKVIATLAERIKPKADYNKAQTIVNAFPELPDDTTVVVSDADVFTPGTQEAVRLTMKGRLWVTPHNKIHRLRKELEVKDLTTDKLSRALRPVDYEILPYRQNPCAAQLVIRAEVLKKVPPDTSFVRWGGMDVAWARALNRCQWRKRLDFPLYHLYHLPQGTAR